VKGFIPTVGEMIDITGGSVIAIKIAIEVPQIPTG
jgi:hypothetical protein